MGEKSRIKDETWWKSGSLNKMRGLLLAEGAFSENLVLLAKYVKIYCINFLFLWTRLSPSMFVLLIILSVLFVVFYAVRRKRLAKEFEEKVRSFIEICDSFFVEFDELFKHYIQDAERDAFVLKYKVLYHELQRYSGISSKVEDFVKLEDFKKKYKDFPGLVIESNVVIKCKELLVKVEPFFVEFDEMLKRYIQDSERDTFIYKYQALYFEWLKYSSISSKTNTFVKLEEFRRKYEDFPRLVFASNAEIKRKENLKLLLQFVNIFFDELDFLTSRYVTDSDGKIFYQKWEKLSQDVAICNLNVNDEEYGKISHFKIIYEDFFNYLEKANKSFVAQESQKYDYLFSNIDGKSLDMQQREAVITDEDRILVLAGAGSGKTLTIAGKVKYLCDVKNISPEEILLISFTKKSAQEMTDRIQGKLGIPVISTTFHKLGLDIIKSADGRRPDVLDESLFNKFIHDFF